MPIEYTDVTKKYNKAICDDLGLTVPEGYEAIEGYRDNLSVTPTACHLPYRGEAWQRKTSSLARGSL